MESPSIMIILKKNTYKKSKRWRHEEFKRFFEDSIYWDIFLKEYIDTYKNPKDGDMTDIRDFLRTLLCGLILFFGVFSTYLGNKKPFG